MHEWDVDGMLARMPSRLFAEWQAYDRLDPIGAWRGDLLAGIVAATIANVHRDPKQRRDPYTANDFMPVWEPKPEPVTTWEDQLRMVELLNAAFGGTDLRERA
jgi:hypothetical protein